MSPAIHLAHLWSTSFLKCSARNWHFQVRPSNSWMKESLPDMHTTLLSIQYAIKFPLTTILYYCLILLLRSILTPMSLPAVLQPSLSFPILICAADVSFLDAAQWTLWLILSCWFLTISLICQACFEFWFYLPAYLQPFPVWSDPKIIWLLYIISSKSLMKILIRTRFRREPRRPWWNAPSLVWQGTTDSCSFRAVFQSTVHPPYDNFI